MTILLTTMRSFQVGKWTFDEVWNENIIFVHIDALKTTSPVSIVLEGLTLQTVSVLEKSSFL